jgi:hypothetical protein
LGHVFAKFIEIISDHSYSDSGSFLDSLVEGTILWRWQDMEVVMIMIIVVVIVRIVIVMFAFRQFEQEVAIFERNVLFLEIRGKIRPCVIISYVPPIVVEGIKIVAEVQFETLISFVVRVDLNVINMSVGWQFFSIRVSQLIAF